MAVRPDEPIGHAGVHHGVAWPWELEPTEVMWISPGSDLLRVDDGVVYAKAPDA